MEIAFACGLETRIAWIWPIGSFATSFYKFVTIPLRQNY